MLEIKVSEATLTQLNWLVAKCEGLLGPDGIRFSDEYCDSLGHDQDGDFTNDWAQGGPIIEREGIFVRPHTQRHSWRCWIYDGKGEGIKFDQHGPTPLIAAMRCYVASKLGDTIEVPEEI